MGHRPGRVAVVLNGNARQVTDQLVESFDQVVGSGDLFLSRSMDEAHGIALSIVEEGYQTVVTGGGDGTFVQMVTSITAEANPVWQTVRQAYRELASPDRLRHLDKRFVVQRRGGGHGPSVVPDPEIRVCGASFQ